MHALWCEWCGNPLNDKVSICTQCHETVKSNWGSIILFPFEIITLALFAFGAIMTFLFDAAIFAVVLLLAGFILALPATRKKIKIMTIGKRRKRVLLNVARILLLVILWFAGILAIPSSSVSATITDNYGNTLEKAAVNLRAENNENSAKFDDQYVGADITVSGTVHHIDHNDATLSLGGKTYRTEVYRIFLEEDWEIIVISSEHPEIIDLQKGDKVRITSQIEGVSGDYIILSYHRIKNLSVLVDYTTIETIS